MYHKNILTNILIAISKNRYYFPYPTEESMASQCHHVSTSSKLKNFCPSKKSVKSITSKRMIENVSKSLSDKRLVSKMSYSIWAAITNYHVLNGLKNIYFHSSGG